MKLRPYQSEIITDIKSDIQAGESKIVMAMCPNSGKTFTSISLIQDLLDSGVARKVLILAHGTTVLRSQFYDSLVELSPTFTYKQITPEDKSTNAQVLVALPQGLNNIDLSGIDLLIVDEAHEFYLASMTQELIKKMNLKATILLTGTPSKFIYENTLKPDSYKIHIVAMSDIPAEYMADTRVYICSSKYNIKETDYNADEEVLTAYKFKKADTEGTIDIFLKEMHKLLKMKYITNADNFIKMSFSELKKTMIACKSQNQARQVHNYLVKKGVNALVSTEDTDKDSVNIEKFVKDSEVKVLIVVNRGILGFNLPSLTNVVDMTGSRNLDIMYQLFSRVTRTHADIKNKRYFKIAPVDEVEYTQYITSAMLSLIHRDNISIYNGKNFKTDIPVLIKRAKGSSESKGGKSKSKGKPKLLKFEGIDVIDVFSKMYSNMDETLQVYSRATLGEIRKALGNSNSLPAGYWTLERCKEEALRYSTRSEWERRSGTSYKIARKKGWGALCNTHMESRYEGRASHTKRACIESAKNYSTRTDWYLGDKKTYEAAHYHGWETECCGHMKPSKSNPKPIVCIETGRVFRSVKEVGALLSRNTETIRMALLRGTKVAGYTFRRLEEVELQKWRDEHGET